MGIGETRRLCWVISIIALACFLWLAGEMTRGRTKDFDEGSRAALHSLANPALTLLMRAATAMGATAVIFGIGGCVAIARFSSGDRGGGWLIAAGIAGAEILLLLLKLYFARTRPVPFVGMLAPGSYSFPSGHAMLSMSGYGLLAALARGRARWIIRAGAMALILAVGASRVYLGVHYTSDVIAGYLFAIAWIGAIFGWFVKR